MAPPLNNIIKISGEGHYYMLNFCQLKKNWGATISEPKKPIFFMKNTEQRKKFEGTTISDC